MIDRGLWSIAQRLFEEDISKGDSEETVDEKLRLVNPWNVAFFSSLNILAKKKGKEYDSKYTERLTTILRETSELMRKGEYPGNYLSTLQTLAGAIDQYPNGLASIKISDHTIMGDLIRVVFDKTLWVISELEHLERLPTQRLEDLSRFCVALSREIRRYDPIDTARYLDAA